jgi:hypothetical protein
MKSLQRPEVVAVIARSVLHGAVPKSVNDLPGIGTNCHS